MDKIFLRTPKTSLLCHFSTFWNLLIHQDFFAKIGLLHFSLFNTLISCKKSQKTDEAFLKLCNVNRQVDKQGQIQ